MSQQLKAALGALSLLLAASPLAEAHPRLITPRPVANATVTAPREVRLTFSEPLVGRFSTLQLRDQNGRLVGTGRPMVSGRGRQLAAALPRLAPGRYRVIWRAVSQDTHRVAGAYVFTVRR